MGNDESCCYEVDEKKGQIQSSMNSINAANGNSKSHVKNAKNVFTTSNGLQEDQKYVNQSKISVKSSKISNQLQQNQFVNFRESQSQSSSHFNAENANKSSFRQNHLSQKSFSFHRQKVYSFGVQNPQNPQLAKGKQIDQQTLNYLKSSNASQKKYQKDYMHERGSSQYRNKEIDDGFEKGQDWPVRVNKSTAQTQITIEYLPIVKQLIQRERPFETQLQRVPKQKIKTLRVNNGKDIYKGQFNYFQIPHGYGVLKKENGNVLIGKFDNGSVNGMAFYVFSNGSYYEGYMKDTKANDDKGEFHSLAMSYVGGFRDNLFHGQAKEIGEGYCFQGVYENHLKKKGILRWNSKSYERSRNPNGEKKYYDKYHGKMKLPEARKSWNIQEYDFEYEGQFDAKQQFTGKGRLKDPNGEYVGEFNQGRKSGQGTYLFDNRLRYVGEYKDNKKQGYGKLYNCDNTMAYEGFWKNNLPDGQGYSYGLENKPVKHEFVQGISRLLAPETQ